MRYKHLFYKVNRVEKEKIISLLVKALDKKEILFSYVHGSFVEEEVFRDIDLAVWVKGEVLPKEKALKYELSLSVDLEYLIEYPADLKVLNYAPLGFQYHVTKGRLLTCLDDDLRVDFLAEVWSKYLDFAPKSREFLLEMLS